MVRITPIDKPWMAIWKGNSPILRGRKLTMVINYLQVLGWSSKYTPEIYWAVLNHEQMRSQDDHFLYWMVSKWAARCRVVRTKQINMDAQNQEFLRELPFQNYGPCHDSLSQLWWDQLISKPSNRDVEHHEGGQAISKGTTPSTTSIEAKWTYRTTGIIMNYCKDP